MDLGDFLKSLKIDAWYKALMYLGAVVFVLSLFLDVKGIGNASVQLLSGGAFLIGLGEWKNRKAVMTFKPPNAYTGGALLMTGTVRSPDIVGIAFVLLGVALIAVAVWRMIHG